MLTLPRQTERGPQRYVAVRRKVTMPFGDAVGPASGELFAAFANAGVAADGMEFIKYNLIDMPDLEIEIGMTTDAAIPLSGALMEGELPGGRYIETTYTGPYDDLYDVTAMLIGWAKERGIRWDMEETSEGDRFAARLEHYHNNPVDEPDPAKLRTTLLFKLASG
ncbi:GyrI-like domain-containing protein [Rhizobium sp. BG4]|uniref:GyrI-like domain-containing protein n=1 Tax=Rhizobium sp. BG4 TaxID=2613770 RepID=UPI00193D05C9|nr:GyrI-like domain-containing protein [Rhizobium sp. BG4]QRM45896.1 GyrI-like domain-containing protein [Rhizobium sp. BG4]